MSFPEFQPTFYNFFAKVLIAMNKSPDLVLVLVVVFVVGAVMTGISQSDLQIAAMMQDAFNS